MALIRKWVLHSKNTFELGRSIKGGDYWNKSAKLNHYNNFTFFKLLTVGIATGTS